MNADDYQRQCAPFDNHDLLYQIPALALGLVAEAGEVANEVERSCRAPMTPVNVAKLRLELGDVLWNVARLASKFQLTLPDIMQANIDKLTERYADRA